jgi:uncharacterized protein YndB with AHSA1/START domain
MSKKISLPTIKTFDFTLTRTIPASPEEVFDGWLDAENPGTPWHGSKKLVLEKKVDGLWHFTHVFDELALPHYGRFVTLERGRKIQYTWMSRHTMGLETTVTVQLHKKGDDTQLTLTHANLPDNEYGYAHDGGWNSLVDTLAKGFRKVHA